MGISKIKPLTSQYHSVGGSRGRGLLCLAPQLVIFVYLVIFFVYIFIFVLYILFSATVRPNLPSVPEHETLTTGRTAACHVGTDMLSCFERVLYL